MRVRLPKWEPPLLAALLFAAFTGAPLRGSGGGSNFDWPTYLGDKGRSLFSPLE